MIITITGKPCSGKGTVSKEFCKKYKFEYVCTGDMFRSHAKAHGYDNILKFQQEYKQIQNVDKLIDNEITNIGKTRSDDKIVIDSRLAWHFIPNSFKVFIDVNLETAGLRLLSTNRDTEKAISITEAMEKLKTRWQVENNRYYELYQTNNLNLSNYDLVVDSSNKTPKQVIKLIYKAYKKHLKQN